ncbi:GNAT family N-acetyltransferase [Natrialbaceae archaeon GCM10025810]|uniref:GNAT family N-acetyltransferase n=1 Tax=Halovalidus salilacus TaxID=3075124 RepID=UPI0036231CA2
MEFELLGWPPDGPTLRLDYRRFSYAGKFVMTSTGKAVARNDADGWADREDVRDDGEDSESGRNDFEDRGDGREDLEGERDGRDGRRGEIVGAVAFNEDRTDEDALWLRYVTVARERRGEGIGPRLCAFVRDRAAARGYDRIRIAVNNPYAYEALYRAGFAYTGETTGIAELVLEYEVGTADDPPRDTAYRAGLREYRDRDLSEEERAFVDRHLEAGPPDPERSR